MAVTTLDWDRFDWTVLGNAGFTIEVNQRGPYIDLSDIKPFTSEDTSALYGKALKLKNKDTSEVTNDNWVFFYLE